MTKWDMRIDGDTILCRAGFSADSRSDEMSHSLYNVKLIIEMLKAKFPGKMSVYLSGSKAVNFRYNLTDTYKSNRALKCKTVGCEQKGLTALPTQQSASRFFSAFECDSCGQMIRDTKPVYYQEIRQYLLAKYSAIAVPWGEADDWLGVNPTVQTVIVSNDKDLLMLPAYHYRLNSEKLLQTSDPGQLWLSEDRKKILGGGFKWFCCQLLMGDAVDGIKKPVKGWGPVKIYDEMGGNLTARQMWDKASANYPDEEALLLNAQLLWISRKPKQMFSFELLEELIGELDNE